MEGATAWIPIGSLIVAALAVFFGPLIMLKIARDERRTSMLVANKQIVAPMRQVWIDKLRDKVADVLSTALWYYVSGQDPDHRETEDAGNRVERRLRFQVQEIELMLNLTESDHLELLATLQRLVGSCYVDSETYMEFPDLHEKAGTVCRRVLKREWNRVKSEIGEEPIQDTVEPKLSESSPVAPPRDAKGADEADLYGTAPNKRLAPARPSATPENPPRPS